MTPFGVALREARKHAGLRLSDVAGMMGWSVVYLSDIERGRRNPPAPEKIVKLAEILKIPAGVLLEAAARTWREIRLPLDDNVYRVELLLALVRNWDRLA
ncbi:helix-turn-helix transcriptional regulator [Thermosulfurimonas sp. F29]|uniref:helix-turn-helix domain-containing protein n=1 Tax=Thermosulfurimonas sp. F29 TaxID=2867247 RepID=UPI001C82BC26|nr:helix-turn-helix domain-containing protein [Thermosulfurimonas sp. F29]